MIQLHSDSSYAIYDLMYGCHGVRDATIAPHSVDFKRGLSQRLHPKRVFTLGEMTEVTWYAQFDGVEYNLPVVKETFQYNRDSTTMLATSRTHTIEWYLDDYATIGPHPKQMEKFYTTTAEKRAEIGRKRYNQTNAASEVVIGALVMAGQPYTDAVTAGQAYWKTLVPVISMYETGDTQPLRDQIAADAAASSPVWLTIDLANAVLAELA